MGVTLDPPSQRAIDARMGDSVGDVRIHRGPRAANACEEINARTSSHRLETYTI